MNVLGMGTDLVAVAAFAEQLRLPGSAFPQAFTAREHRYATARAEQLGSVYGPAEHLAARWAAKESVIKAWSAAIYGQPPVLQAAEVDWQEIEIVNDRWFRPQIVLRGQIAQAVPQSLGVGPDDLLWQVSLSHDGDYAMATVILCMKP